MNSKLSSGNPDMYELLHLESRPVSGSETLFLIVKKCGRVSLNDPGFA